jgi:hypothetical protein
VRPVKRASKELEDEEEEISAEEEDPSDVRGC